MATSAVGLDFGGTAVKAGLVDADGTRHAEASMPIGLERGPDDVIARAAELARSVGATSASALGVGCAGLLDRSNGTLVDSPNLQALTGRRLAVEIARALGIGEERTVFENDANVAAVGEQWLGAARGERDAMIITLGTGVGGGIVLRDELYIGAAGHAGEIGHVVVDPTGLKCGCGSRGCLETLGSATAARRRALEAGLPQSAPGDLIALAQAARDGAPAESELMHAIGRDLGAGLAYPAVLLDMECFVFAGGFAAALDVLESGILAGMSERLFGERAISLRSATLGGSAGWIGAARLALLA